MHGKMRGFTLIELIMVIVIIGILGVMGSKMITLPMHSYFDQQRRTTLADNAESALRLMQRDIRRALPNSLRISGGGKVLELLHTSDGGHYRTQPASDGSGDVLNFTATDNSFDILGTLSNTPQGELVIYNLGQSPADAYAGDNRATLANTSSSSLIKLSTAKRFPLQSPQQRFFIVDTPITYRCDTASGHLLRYSGYTITAAQPNPPSGVSGQLQVNHLSDCSFSYTSATANRAGLLTLQLNLTDASGESVRLIQQVHVDNLP